ncbi:PAS domain S-box protein [Candidatus Pacearchaeota archaeon]|nr:PAS domain S-box protein [Candidatus Pacearchaeota archaeon]
MQNKSYNEYLTTSTRAAVLDSAIITETDLQGKITYVNDNFVKATGFSKREIIGNTHKIINSGYHSKEFFKDMWDTISSGKVWRGVIREISKDGDYVWFDSIIAPVLGKDGKQISYISIRFDITPYMGN